MTEEVFKNKVKRSSRSKKNFIGGQGDGVPKASPEQAAADSRGSRTCVCASTLLIEEVAHAGEEG